jgi:hypothetical protein
VLLSDCCIFNKLSIGGRPSVSINIENKVSSSGYEELAEDLIEPDRVLKFLKSKLNFTKLLQLPGLYASKVEYAITTLILS